MEIFEQAAEGDIGSIVILVVVGFVLMRFFLKLLKFVFVQFPALAGGLVFGLAFAEDDGVNVELVIQDPNMWDILFPYVLPALAVAFVIWNVILSILKSVFRSVFKKAQNAVEDSKQSSRLTGQKSGQRDRTQMQQDRIDSKAEAVSQSSAMQTRKRHMDDYDTRNKRIHQHELSHRDKNLGQPIVQRRIKANRTVTRRIEI